MQKIFDHRTLKKGLGFTLIELLAVIAIIGFIASAGAYYFSNAQKDASITRGLSFSQSVNNSLGSEAVGIWSFDEKTGPAVIDGSGKDNNGILVGPVWRCAETDSDYTPSGQGCALLFDGNDYVNVGTHGSLYPENITIQAWVNASSISSWDGIISNMSAWGTGFGLQMGQSQNIAAMISGSYLQTTWAPKVNTWYHIVATHDSATNLNVLYVNGKEERRSTRAVSFEPNAKTYIGAFYTTPGLLFNGLIDDVRIYNQTLNMAEVKMLYAQGITKYQLAKNEK